MKLMELPEELELYKDIIESTLLPFIKIEATINPNTELWQSKFGGNPYFPKDMEYPKDSIGEPMLLLAQLNFEEMPNLENFPNKGILQFYINVSKIKDYYYGLNFSNHIEQKNFRVIYHPETIKYVNKLLIDFNNIPTTDKKDFYNSPINTTSSLNFIKSYSPLTDGDYRLEILLFKKWQELDIGICWENRRIYGEYVEKYFGEGEITYHQIGGYPNFVQGDPREYSKEYRIYDILLFQMDTDALGGGGKEILWGDMGIANFFIKNENLKRLDFSDILYEWSCC